MSINYFSKVWPSMYSRYLPVYSGLDGCLNHWEHYAKPVEIRALEYNPGDSAKDITEINEGTRET